MGLSKLTQKASHGSGNKGSLSSLNRKASHGSGSGPSINGKLNRTPNRTPDYNSAWKRPLR